jgi:hypothetical protein
MDPALAPFWFKQRQCKAEPAGENALKATGPNLGEAYLRVEPDGGRWRASLRQKPDGADVAATAAKFPSPAEAWEAAFELYRVHVIV